MNKIKRFFNNTNFQLIIFIIVFFIVMILFSNWRENQCIKKGGKVVETNLGIMEKCILGDKEND